MKFIEDRGYKAASFEKKCGLPNATLANTKKRDGDLTADVVETISNRFGRELEAAGYHIIDMRSFGRQELAILSSEEAKNVVSSLGGAPKQEPIIIKEKVEVVPPYLDKYMQKIEENEAWLKKIVESSLGEIADRQRTVQAEIQAVHQWDAQITAGGDKAKEEASLHHIQQLVADNREKILKNGNSAGVGR